MALAGPILIIDDDPDDQELIKNALDELRLENAILSFTNGKEAIDYLAATTDQPFLILCDVNMPVMNGLEMRDHIFHNDHLRKKAIPFVFFTTSANKKMVDIAYDLTVQGFYQKADSYSKLKEQIKLIITYWQSCLHPNRYIL